MEDIKLQSHVGGATNEQFFSNKIKICKHGFRQGSLGKKTTTKNNWKRKCCFLNQSQKWVQQEGEVLEAVHTKDFFT